MFRAKLWLKIHQAALSKTVIYFSLINSLVRDRDSIRQFSLTWGNSVMSCVWWWTVRDTYWTMGYVTISIEAGTEKGIQIVIKNRECLEIYWRQSYFPLFLSLYKLLIFSLSKSWLGRWTGRVDTAGLCLTKVTTLKPTSTLLLSVPLFCTYKLF